MRSKRESDGLKLNASELMSSSSTLVICELRSSLALRNIAGEMSTIVA